MKRITTSLLLSLGLSPVCVYAQDFILTSQHVASPGYRTAPAETTVVKADWSKEDDRVDASISKAKLTKMKGVTNALVNFLRDSCLGAGDYSPTWRGEYFSGKNSPGAQLKFGMVCHFDEQNADLSITANDMLPLMDQLEVNGQHFLTMRIPRSTDRNTLFYTDGDGSDGSAVQTKMWLVAAAGGKLPFTPVTRATYLTEAKAELTAMVKSIESGWKLKAPVRTAAEQDDERKAVIDQLKTMYSGADLDIRVRIYERSYKTDEEFQRENIARETAGFKATIRLMDSLMTHLGAVQLALPAVVSVAAADFHGFEDGVTNYMLIRMNNAYFNATLSNEKPQLFLVTWHYDAANSSTAALDCQLTERLNVRVLQRMLGR